MSVNRRLIVQELRLSTVPSAFAPTRARNALVETLFDDGLPYSRKLCGHTACVNALAFSQSGRWLASGGDDPHILLWDFHQDDLSEPSRRFAGHRTNVFALAFSATTKYIYSGATDNTIHRYDLEYACTSTDSRTVTGPDTIHLLHKHDAEFTSVQFHPEMFHIFVTSDNRGEVCLRDTRMAFGPNSRRRNKGIVRKYVTTITKPSIRHLSNPEVSSVTFDRTGTKLAATMVHHSPTIYAVSDPYPVAVCTAATLPDGSPTPPGERTYANACTIKHGSFGGGGLLDEPYYCAGSDDFRAYMWKIPPSAVLTQRRREISAEDWPRVELDTIGFAASSTGLRYVPITISRPVTRLTGHRSIVNTALMHPMFPAVCTAGIERSVILHSPTPATPFLASDSLTLTPSAMRPLPSSESSESKRLAMRALGILPGVSDEDESEDDSMSIALFDQYVAQKSSIDLEVKGVCRILRQESGLDVFQVRRLGHEEDTDDTAVYMDET
ncbi:WD40 repeat-like protein [Daedalea quercina L-15889]|uniref:WD40 repeat-like protein n=1 Tax=Daedalea quercina L-15889 TaxID=1314783 RepID=A0A165LDL8_9APHY|nr:WD40 repeat-like protein [Daedalea quercina L-15889]